LLTAWFSFRASLGSRVRSCSHPSMIAFSPILNGMQIFHNYVRPHEGPNGRTPSQLAGIEVEGENRWLTLIQNAADHPTKLDSHIKRRHPTRA
jgi:hypothetical protein